jgi:hypothetical protein
MKKFKKFSKKKYNKNNPYPSFYMFSHKLYKNNNKVIENITQEVKNNKLYTKGYVNGKKINKTTKLKSYNV